MKVIITKQCGSYRHKCRALKYDGSYEEIDFRNHKNRDLLAKEYTFCKKKDTIIKKLTVSLLSKRNQIILNLHIVTSNPQKNSNKQ